MVLHQTLPSALPILTSMITPAILISACGTLILSTSNRIGRTVDRVRRVSDQIEEISQREMKPMDPDLQEERLSLIYNQLNQPTRRIRLLQNSLTSFYLAVGIFVATSLSIGIVSVIETYYGWPPVILGMLGACFLFHGSLLLIFEARIALKSTYKEMLFLRKLAENCSKKSQLRSQLRDR